MPSTTRPTMPAALTDAALQLCIAESAAQVARHAGEGAAKAAELLLTDDAWGQYIAAVQCRDMANEAADAANNLSTTAGLERSAPANPALKMIALLTVKERDQAQEHVVRAAAGLIAAIKQDVRSMANDARLQEIARLAETWRDPRGP